MLNFKLQAYKGLGYVKLESIPKINLRNDASESESVTDT